MRNWFDYTTLAGKARIAGVATLVLIVVGLTLYFAWPSSSSSSTAPSGPGPAASGTPSGAPAAPSTPATLPPAGFAESLEQLRHISTLISGYGVEEASGTTRILLPAEVFNDASLTDFRKAAVTAVKADGYGDLTDTEIVRVRLVLSPAEKRFTTAIASFKGKIGSKTFADHVSKPGQLGVVEIPLPAADWTEERSKQILQDTVSYLRRNGFTGVRLDIRKVAFEPTTR